LDERGLDVKISIEKLNIELARRQLSVTEFCMQTKIPQVTVDQIRRGVRQARPKTIGRIAAGLGVDVTEIIEQDGR